MKQYLYQQDNWPQFNWDNDALLSLLGLVRNLQGKVIGKMETLGFDLRNEATLATLTLDVIKSTEIEGEILNPEQVRSSLARRLGMDISGLIPSDRNVDGIVEMMLDATLKSDNELTKERLFDWHYALFPTGRSGMYKIIVGNWRDDSTGPMQVVSGPLGKEKIHYQAPDATLIDREMQLFINWINKEGKLDLVMKAALAHLWFLTIHPFEDGNGRIARAITDMILSRADGIKQRFYSMSSQIRIERKDYYSILEQSQKGTLDVTDWLQWFLSCLLNAIQASDTVLAKVLYKHKFWNENATQTFNNRQIVMLNQILDGFFGKITSSKWAKITKCSNDTALRDIQDLIQKKILRKEMAGGRSSSYELNDEK
ncbi:MAG: Fic family protein [Flavobacteriaceae bacterium]|nr:Fic family protein [Flavobacteriaceae bacterium]